MNEMQILLAQKRLNSHRKRFRTGEKDAEIAEMKKETTEMNNNPFSSSSLPIPPHPPQEDKKFNLNMEDGEYVGETMMISGRDMKSHIFPTKISEEGREYD
jgi:hypothetical protein